MSAEQLEERAGVGRFSEHRIEEHDIERAAGLGFQIFAVIGTDHLDQLRRLARGRCRAPQAGRGEGREQSVDLQADHLRSSRLRGDERIAAEAERRVQDALAGAQR